MCLFETNDRKFFHVHCTALSYSISKYLKYLVHFPFPNPPTNTSISPIIKHTHPRLFFFAPGAGGASVSGILLAEQPESKRERAAGITRDDAACQRSRPARASHSSLAPSQVPSSPPPPSPPSPPPPPSTATAHPAGSGRRPTEGRRSRRSSDAWRRPSRRQHDAGRRRAQDDRSDLQRRPEDRHVHPRQGDHLRKRGGSRPGGRVPTPATLAAIPLATLRGHQSRTTAARLRHTQIRLRDGVAPSSLSPTAVATRGRPSTGCPPRGQRHRA